MKDFRNNTNLNRGIRNNNPGNLVKTKTTWIGKVPLSQNTDSRFEQFVSMEYGVRALMRNIITYMNRGYNTLELLIHQWAPVFENNTTRYINKVSKRTGIDKNEEIKKIDAPTLIQLAKAIAFVENAPQDRYINDEVYRSAINMLGLDLSKLEFKKKRVC